MYFIFIETRNMKHPLTSVAWGLRPYLAAMPCFRFAASTTTSAGLSRRKRKVAKLLRSSSAGVIFSIADPQVVCSHSLLFSGRQRTTLRRRPRTFSTLQYNKKATQNGGNWTHNRKQTGVSVLVHQIVHRSWEMRFDLLASPSPTNEKNIKRGAK